MPFILESRRRKNKTLKKRYPEATIIDLTSRAHKPWVKFSPFYLHGGIPVPNSSGVTAMSVEGIWQGLKVFKGEGIDTSRFELMQMRGVKRTTKTHGQVLGHQAGVRDETLLNYVAARKQIYLPAYKWTLEHKLQPELEQLRKLSAEGDVVLLDHETNADINNVNHPLSHASLVIAWLEGNWPA